MVVYGYQSAVMLFVYPITEQYKGNNSGISIKRTLYKADISLRRIVYLGTNGFTVKLL